MDGSDDDSEYMQHVFKFVGGLMRVVEAARDSGCPEDILWDGLISVAANVISSAPDEVSTSRIATVRTQIEVCVKATNAALEADEKRAAEQAEALVARLRAAP